MDETSELKGKFPPPEKEVSAPTDSGQTNVKETIESILVAFILAFIFRAFVVEAFVIPTGSMAPTLLGAHLRYRCEDCGYEFTVNYSSAREGGDDVFIPSRANDGLIDKQGRQVDKVYHIICPNCGYRVQRYESDPDNAAKNPPVHYGDRILVLKYLYLFQEPKRWDVVVFKAPERPQEYDYSQNYIKRLVGKPGETIMVLDGDIYVAPQDPVTHKPKSRSDLLPDDFIVQTKPATVQDSLWRIVYDNDYYPQNIALGRTNGNESKWRQPWTPDANQSGWQPLEGRTFHFDNLSGGADISFDPTANPQTQPLSDWLAYDVTQNQGSGQLDSFDRPVLPADDNVSDIRLSFYYQRMAGDGPIRAELSKIDHRFIAEIAQGKATLYQRIKDGPETVIRTVALQTTDTRPMRVDLINCDYQVILQINGREIISTTPQEYHPDVRALLDAFASRVPHDMPKPSIRISAANQRCDITHLSLWRDIYYMDRQLGGAPLNNATPEDFPKRLMQLQANPPEYFVCGDNSPISGDGRYWQTPIDLPREALITEAGKVPDRFLLGKAFFVYWPAGYRPMDSAPAIIPNFGELRFIH